MNLPHDFEEFVNLSFWKVIQCCSENVRPILRLLCIVGDSLKISYSWPESKDNLFNRMKSAVELRRQPNQI